MLQRSIAQPALDPEAEAWAERIEDRRTRLMARGGEVRCAVGPVRLGRQRTFRISIARLADTISSSARWGRVLVELVRALRPTACIEVGAAAGFASAYLAAGLEMNGAGRLVCIEASADCAGIATQTLSELRLDRAEVLVGRGEDRIADALEAAGPFQLAFLDDDHRRRGTIAATDRLLEALSPGGVLMIDDVHLSLGMRRAWRAISRDPRLSVTADCGRVGVAVLAG